MANEKKKTVGKFIVVILGVAIVCFLLLPFLQSPADTPKASGQKATPQIFTSNPLTDLVNKVYSFFARKQGRKQAINPSLAQATYPTQEAARYDVSQEQDQVNVTYDNYGNAEFINEDGEWIVVRQTAPENGQRGMHEINTTDSAYDRYLRQARAAQYTGRTAPTQSIPDSKWARMWQPIKHFFGLDTQPQPIASARMPNTSGHGATDPLDASRNVNPFATNNFGLDWSWSPWNAAPGAEVSAGDLLNPLSFLEEITDDLQSTSDKLLNDKDAKEVKGILEDKKAKYINRYNQMLANQLDQEATAEAQNLVAQTVSCSGTKSSSLYASEGSAGCEHDAYNAEEFQATRQQSMQNLAKAIGLAPQSAQAQKPMDMLVLLGKTTPQDSLARPEITDPEIRSFLDFFEEYFGCKKHDCYWVGANQDWQKDPSLKTVIESAGGNYVGEGNQKTHQVASVLNAYIEREAAKPDYDGRFDAVGTDSPDPTEKLMKAVPQYMPKTRQEVESLLARNTASTGKRPTNPLLVIMADPNNAKQLHDEGTLKDLAFVVYDKTGQILNATATTPDENGDDMDLYTTNLERGAALNKILVNRINQSKNFLKTASQDMSHDVATRSTKAAATEVAKEFEQGGKKYF